VANQTSTPSNASTSTNTSVVSVNSTVANQTSTPGSQSGNSSVAKDDLTADEKK
jgi:hypothetical protein